MSRDRRELLKEITEAILALPDGYIGEILGEARGIDVRNSARELAQFAETCGAGLNKNPIDKRDALRIVFGYAAKHAEREYSLSFTDKEVLTDAIKVIEKHLKECDEQLRIG